jgi:hypothetical protein
VEIQDDERGCPLALFLALLPFSSVGFGRFSNGVGFGGLSNGVG